MLYIVYKLNKLMSLAALFQNCRVFYLFYFNSLLAKCFTVSKIKKIMSLSFFLVNRDNNFFWQSFIRHQLLIVA